MNVPWSFTPFRWLFHRETSVGGNENTNAVSKYHMSRVEEEGIFKSTHSPAYKQIVDLGTDLTLMSIDTGVSGNIFGGHYFDMNYRH